MSEWAVFRWTPQPVIVRIRDNGDFIRVLVSSYHTIIIINSYKHHIRVRLYSYSHYYRGGGGPPRVEPQQPARLADAHKL